MWPFKKSKETQENKPEKQKNRLSIYFKDGSYTWYEVDYDGSIGMVAWWRDFYKWYFCRTESTQRIMRFKTGERLIKREDIAYFRVDIVNAKSET